MNKWVRGVYYFALGSILSLSLSAFAINGRTTYQAKIYKPDGLPLEAVSVNFRFTVLDPSASCVLYIEDYVAVNMIGSGGLTSFSLGMGARAYPVSGPVTFASVFDNSTPSFVCQAPGVYNPIATDNRKIVMQFNEGNGWQTLPAMAINSVPYAMYSAKAQNAQSLNGKADTAFVEYSTLAALNCQADEAIKFNGVSFSCIAVGVSSSGISSVTTSGTVLSTTGTASAPVISINVASLSSDGYLTSVDYAEFKAKLSASSTEIINTLGYAPVSGSAVNSQIQASQLSGDVSGTVSANVVQSVGGKTAAQISTSVNDTVAATSSATADTIVKRNSSGNITVNDISANAAKLSYVDIYKPSTSFHIRLEAPTSLAANYTLALPATSGSVGQVLSTDGAGQLSWISPSTGSVTNVSATAPLTSTGGATPTISISQATSSTNGYLSATDWSTFNNKQQATSAAIIATLGYTPANVASSTQWLNSASDIYFNTGNVGIGTAAPTAALTIAAGTSSRAPMKFTSGTLLTSPQSGTMEYDGSNYYLTDGANQRRMIATGSTPGSIDNATNINSTSNITMTPNAGSVVVSATTPSTSSNNGALVVKGGLGVAGNINAGGNLNVSGSTVIDGSLRLSGFTSGSVLFAGSNGVVSENNAKFFWNGSRLGLGTNTPSASLEVKQTSATVKVTSTDGISPTLLKMNNNGLFNSIFGSEGIAGTTFADSLTFATIVGAESAVPLQFAANGSVKATILTNGNMGIGTTNPTSNFEINGTTISNGQFRITTPQDVAAAASLFMRFNDVNGSAAYLGFGGTANQFQIQNYKSGAITLATSNTERLRVDASGNVGIGTTNPTTPLHVAVDGAVGWNSVMKLETTNTNTHPLLMFRHGGNDTAYVGFGGSIGTDNGFGLHNYLNADLTLGTSSTTMMTIKPSGNIGIGTNSPVTKLDVRGPNGSPSSYASGTIAINGGGVAALLLGTDDTTASAEYAWIQSHGTRPLYINKVGNNTILNSNGGAVGIGTSNPTTRLEVAGGDVNVPTGRMMFNSNTQTGTAGIASTDAGAIFGEHDLNSEVSRLVIEIFDNVNDQIILRTNAPSGGSNVDMVKVQYDQVALAPTTGNVGVGVATPTSKLQVNGGIKQPNLGQLWVTFDGTTRIASMPTFLTDAYMDTHQDEVFTWRGPSPSLKDSVGCNSGPNGNYMFSNAEAQWNGTYRLIIGKVNATNMVEIQWSGWGVNLIDASFVIVNTNSYQGLVNATLTYSGGNWTVEHMQGQVGITPFSCH